MTIEKTANGSALTLKVIGRLDTTTAPQLEGCVRESIAGISELTIDFGELDYISSAGLRVLLSTQKEMNKQGSMKVVNVNEMVMEVFEITGFVDVLTIE